MKLKTAALIAMICITLSYIMNLVLRLLPAQRNPAIPYGFLYSFSGFLFSGSLVLFFWVLFCKLNSAALRKILEEDESSNVFSLPIAAFVLSLISIPLQISCVLMVNHDPTGLNELIKELKPVTGCGSLIISAMAFLSGGIGLFDKTPSRKYAVSAMIISVLSVLIFFAMVVQSFHW
jgi:hypothetical protein